MADLIFPNDVAAAFNHEKFTAITGKPVPTVTTVKIDGGGVYDGYGSFEASLDVQQVLGGAPGANVTLVSIPDLSDQSIIDGYSYIVDSNQYDIVNSSFGGCENVYTRQYNKGTDFTYILQIEDEIYLQGNAQGITFVASSGDEGALECPTPDYLYGGNHAVFVKGASSPADDPNVTAVGGGNLITGQTAGSLDSPYVRESAYGDPEAPYDIYGLGVNVAKGIWGAGGGVSAIFGRPAYQALVKTNSPAWRTLPDVGMQVGGLGFSGVACEAITCGADDSSVLTAYGVGLGGGYYYTIGTSVSSPEFVGALALYEQGAHRQGNVNTYLYQAAAAQNAAGGASAPADKQYFHRNIPGYDGAYTGGQPNANYNYIYGNGSPDVRKLFGLTGYAPAGTPQTAGNP
jgi:subtilase family serine protease